MKFIGSLLAVSMLFAAACEAATAGEIIFVRRYRPTAQETALQQRQTLQEKAHQIKALRETARLNAQRAKISSQSTVQYYGTPKPQYKSAKRHARKGLVHQAPSITMQNF